MFASAPDDAIARTARPPTARFPPHAVGVAQLVELLVVVQAVAGSSPVAHPSRKPGLMRNQAGLAFIGEEPGAQ